VNQEDPDPRQEGQVDGTEALAFSSSAGSSFSAGSQATLPATPQAKPRRSEAVMVEAMLGTPAQGMDNQEEESSSEGEFLSLAKPKSFLNKKAIKTSSKSLVATAEDPSLAKLKSPPKSSRPDKGKGLLISNDQDDNQEDDQDDDEDDDVFHFETMAAPLPPVRAQSPEDEEDSESEADDELSETNENNPKYSTSPAVKIPARPDPSIPPVSPMSKFQSGSVGSYKGRSIHMPVVINPELHAQVAASLGDFNSFVGGPNGGSGVDEADMNSFRASLSNVSNVFNGTPRSLTERMMMEDAKALRDRQRRPQPNSESR
jgi:hypothetical protein